MKRTVTAIGSQLDASLCSVPKGVVILFGLFFAERPVEEAVIGLLVFGSHNSQSVYCSCS